MALEQEELTGKIIGAAIQVHRTLGPGFVEAIYEKALVLELKKRGIKVACEVHVPVCYEGVVVGRHRLDLLVEDQIIVELKAVNAFDDAHFAVVKSYLKATGLKHGLLLNFGKKVLDPRRVIHSKGNEFLVS
jgi:GxxExxY protein